MPSLAQYLESQVAPLPDGPIKARARGNLDVMHSIAAELVKIANDVNLSPSGKRSKVADTIKPHLHHVMRSDGLIDQALAKLSDRESGLASRSTLDEKRAPIRAEIRAAIKPMSRGDHVALVQDPNTDPEILESIIEAPSMLHGVDADLRVDAAKRLAALRNPGAVAIIQQNREALQVVRSTAEALRDQIGEAVGLRNRREVDAMVNAHITDRRHIDADVTRSVETI